MLKLGKNQLTHLWMNHNAGLKGARELPDSLEVIFADRAAIIENEFGGMRELKTVRVYQGSTERNELKGLGEEV